MTVRAAVIPAPGSPVEVRSFPEPVLEPGAALLRTRYSEVCGTDVHLQHGRLAGVPYPLIPGHINVGTLERLNGSVCDAFSAELAEGDLVTFLDVHETCHNCWYCLVAKASTRCPQRKVYGITYGAEEGLLGGWSELILLKPGVKIMRLPEGLPAELAIAGGCALPTAFHAVERGQVGLGDHVLVQGTGPVGLMAGALARLSGAQQVIAIGAPDLRLDMARRLGADHVLNLQTTTPAERREAVLALTGGRGADVTIEASGNPQAVPEGMRLTRDAGVYVVVGQYTDAGPVEFNPHLDLNRKHLDVRATWGIDFSHLYKALHSMARFRDDLPWGAVISAYYGLEDANEALRAVAAGEVVKAVMCPNGRPQ
ncbi:zinc-binding dehydrogenase [bacterium]|nr:zinc-binding dehydrogenase [bacterium]